MAVRGLPVTLLLLVALTGCGSESPERHAQSNADVDTVAVSDFSRLESWGVGLAEPELEKPVRLAQQLAVFSRPARPEDAIPWLPVDRGPDSAEGRERTGHGRLLIDGVSNEQLDELGPQTLSLYAVPTDRGWVCAYIAYDELGDLAVGAECEHGLVDGLGLTLQGEGTFYRLYGVVEDSITKAWVQIGDRRLPAQVGSNGFYFEAKTTDVCPTEIEAVLVDRDGETTEVPWSRLAPVLAGASNSGYACG